MKVLDIVERDDGFCDMNCEFSEEEVNILLEYAVNRILEEQLKRYGGVVDEQMDK